jgi:hypothetical protein
MSARLSNAPRERNQWFAAAEAAPAISDIQLVAALPGLMPETPRGRAVAAAYAALSATAPGGASAARQARRKAPGSHQLTVRSPLATIVAAARSWNS